MVTLGVDLWGSGKDSVCTSIEMLTSCFFLAPNLDKDRRRELLFDVSGVLSKFVSLMSLLNSADSML